jgi:sulfide dehydrogenase [flavocytochrome c] flavoprotein subunit
VSLAALSDKLHVRLVRSVATAIDFDRRRVTLQNKAVLPYDRLVVAPGIDFKWHTPEGYDEQASLIMPHAWKAGPQTERLRQQLIHMPNGGVVGISVPQAPFRCPPGPYERASLIAHFLQRHKPRSKILLLDANDKFSKQALFQQAWNRLYPGMIEWVPFSHDGAVRRIGMKSMELFTELERHRVAVANVIPAQQAGRIALQSGLADSSGWCPVHPASFASKQKAYTHVLGDACLADPMPKSATSANSQAKTCALAILSELAGQTVPPASLHNTCYSLVRDDYGISINAEYHVDSDTISQINGAGGTSPLDADDAFRQKEARFAAGWYESIRRDSFGES